MKVEIKKWQTDEIIVCGEYESVRDCLEKNIEMNFCGASLVGASLVGASLDGARLDGACLDGASLDGAFLDGASLVGACLDGAIGYAGSHDFFKEIVRRQKLETFDEKEWMIIAVITIHHICWNTIKNRFGADVMPIFDKLANVGFGEWREKYKKVMEDVNANE